MWRGCCTRRRPIRWSSCSPADAAPGRTGGPGGRPGGRGERRRAGCARGCRRVGGAARADGAAHVDGRGCGRHAGAGGARPPGAVVSGIGDASRGVAMTETADCLFCRIVAGEIPADDRPRDRRHVAFRDVAPQAPTHVWSIPRQHHRDIATLASADPDLAGRLMADAAQVGGRRSGWRSSGWCSTPVPPPDSRSSTCTRTCMAGRDFGWPPGLGGRPSMDTSEPPRRKGGALATGGTHGRQRRS